MKSKEFEKKYLPYVKRVADKLMLCEFYPIELSYKKNLGNAYATFDTTYPYKNININYCDELMEQSDSMIKDILVHELCHALTDPLYLIGTDRYAGKEELNNAREELTDRLANIMRKNKMI